MLWEARDLVLIIAEIRRILKCFGADERLDFLPRIAPDDTANIANEKPHAEGNQVVPLVNMRVDEFS